MQHHHHPVFASPWASTEYSDDGDADDELSEAGGGDMLNLFSRNRDSLVADWSRKRRESAEICCPTKRALLDDDSSDNHTGLSPRFQSLKANDLRLPKPDVFFLDGEDRMETFCADATDHDAMLRQDAVVRIKQALMARIEKAGRVGSSFSSRKPKRKTS